MVKFSNPRKDFRVHILVAKAFIPNPDNKPYVNHIDNNPSNPNLSNLEWCTQQENIQHAAKQGRIGVALIGKRSNNACLNGEEVKEIRILYKENGYSYSMLATKFNMSKRAIGRIINMETYSDV